MLFSPWIPASMLLIFAVSARVLDKTWQAPSAFVLGVWSVYVIVPLALVPDYPVSGLAIWTVSTMLVCISAGAMLGEGHSVWKQPKQIEHPKNTLRTGIMFTLFGLVGIAYFAVYGLRGQGLDFSIGGLLLLGNKMYFSSDQPPILVRLLTIWLFPAALLGGIGYMYARTRLRRILCCAWLVPALIYSILNAQRANTLIAVILSISGYVSMRVLHHRPWRPLSRKSLMIVAISIFFFFTVDALRYNQDNHEGSRSVDSERLKVYTWGYLSVFSHWAKSDNLAGQRVALGAYTFGGIADALGISERKPGVFEENVTFGGVGSNVHTAFRGMIEDFSVLGAGVFCGLLGFWAGSCYRHVRLGRLTWVPFLAVFYAFVVWSPVISLFNYNAPILAVLASWAVLRKSRPGAQPQQLRDARLPHPA